MFAFYSLLLLLSLRGAGAQWASFSVPASPAGTTDVVVRAVSSSNSGIVIGGSRGVPSAGNTLWISLKNVSTFVASASSSTDAMGALMLTDGSMAWSFTLSTPGTSNTDFVTDVASASTQSFVVFVGIMGPSLTYNSGPVSIVTARTSTMTWAFPSSFGSLAPAGFALCVNASGSLLWSRRIGGATSPSAPTGLTSVSSWPWSLQEVSATGEITAPYANEGAYGVAVNSEQDTYVAAQIGQSTPTFTDSGTVNSAFSNRDSGMDAVLGKFGSSGGLLWYVRLWGTGDEGAFGVAASPDDAGAWVVGTSGSTSLSLEYFNGTKVPSQQNLQLSNAQGTTSAFIVKVSKSGSVGAVLSIVGDNTQSASSVAAMGVSASNGGVYVVGSFVGTITLAGLSLTAPAGSGIRHGFLAKVSLAGSPVWLALAGAGITLSAAGGVAWRVSTGGDGSPYVFGSSGYSQSYFGVPTSNPPVSSDSGYQYMFPNGLNTSLTAGFVAKMNASTGARLWISTAVSALGTTSGTSLAGAPTGSGVVFAGALSSGNGGINATIGGGPCPSSSDINITPLSQNSGRSGFASFIDETCSCSGQQNSSVSPSCQVVSSMVVAVGATTLKTELPSQIVMSAFLDTNLTCYASYTCSALNAASLSGAAQLISNNIAVYNCTAASYCPPTLTAAAGGSFVGFTSLNSSRTCSGVANGTTAWPAPNVAQPSDSIDFGLYGSSDLAQCTSNSYNRAWLLPLPPSPPLPPLPLPPLPPSPPAASAFFQSSVAVTVRLGGYTVQSFDQTALAAYKRGLVPLLGLPNASYVNVISVSDASTRRHLSAIGVAVATMLYSDAPAAQSGLAAAVASLTPASLTIALQSAGLASVSVQALAVGACALAPCLAGASCSATPNLAANSSFTCTCSAGQAGDGVTQCVSCGAIPTPTIQPSFLSPLLASLPARFEAASGVPSGTASGPCSFAASYKWALFDGAGVAQSVTGGASSLSVDASSLAVGASARVTLQVCYANNSTLPCSSLASLSFVVSASPLIAAISGGGGTLSEGSAAAQLDGSLSVDPDGRVGLPLAFRWSCVGPVSNVLCLDAAGAPLTPASGATLSLTRLPGAPGAGLSYTFTLLVSKDSRSATAATTVTVVRAVLALPLVSIAALPLSRVNPSERTTLYATVTPATPGEEVSLRWSLSPGSAATATALGAGVIDDPCTAPGATLACRVSTTPVTSAAFVLLPNALSSGGAVYTFRLTATEAGRVAYAELAVPTLAVYPQPGVLGAVAPASGTALVTLFNLSASNWSVAGNSSADLPLRYSFAYLAGGQTAPVLLIPFRAVPQASVFLPAGSLSILVFVQTARGATSSLATALALQQPVTVLNASTAQLSTAVGTATSLALGGKADAALQLAGGLAASFNALPSGEAARLAAREQLIVSVNVSLTSQGSSSASELQTVAAALSSLTSVPGELSYTSRTSALHVLQAVAGLGTAVNAPTASAVVFSLSNVSSSGLTAAQGSASETRAVVAAVLTPVLIAVQSLASSLQAQLSAAGEVPVAYSSPNVQTQVGLDYASPLPGVFTRLFNGTIGAASSPASFGALPADALSRSNVSAVNTSFHFLTFDPFSGSVNGSGSSRLLLSAAGAALEVQNLSRPILISLPALPSASLQAGATPALCTFWNVSRQAYSADGCLGLPNPLPPGLSAFFNVSAAPEGSGARALLGALAFSPASSPLLTGCQTAVLDCAAAGTAGVFFLNPDDPFAAPAVRCPSLDAPVVGRGGTLALAAPPLFILYGARCALWNSSNTIACYWNATLQAFQGAGCAASTSQSQCLCSHLTDFSTLTFPTIAVATPAQMLAITPGDLITKLRFFLALIVGLFGAMHLGAAIGYVMDRRSRARVLAELTSPDLGFVMLSSGVWTWSVFQDPLRDSFGAVTGPAVRLAQLVGVPYVRLRCAIPEELLAGDIVHVVGRTEGLSVAASKAGTQELNALLASAYGKSESVGCCTGGVSAADEDTRMAEEAPAGDKTQLDEAAADAACVTSTALLFALLWMRLLLPREELIVRQAAASRHFARTRTVSGNFDTLVGRFLDLLSSGNLHSRTRWLMKSRLWRLILLQDPDGFWSATPGLAFALHASSARIGSARGAPVGWQRVLRMLCGKRAANNWEDDGGEHTPSPESVGDDPLHFSVSAVLASMPSALLALPGGSEQDSLPSRVWATLLSMELMDRLECCWVVNGMASKDFDEPEVTLADAADVWLAARAAEDPLLAAALPHARAKASRMMAEWEMVQEERVAELRSFSQGGKFYTATQLSRLTGDCAKAVQTKHEIFSTFLGAPQDGMQRWQKWMLLCTAILGALTVEVWFFQVKANACCGQVRQLLGCSDDFAAPCRGFSGDCADVEAQFAELLLPDGSTIATFECHAFPDEDNPLDKFFIGLIFAAVAIPMRYILGILLEIANEAEHSEAWLEFSQVQHTVARLLGLRWSWHYADPALRPSRLLRLYARYALEPFNMAIDLVVDAISAAALACARLTGCGCTGNLESLAALDKTLHSADVCAPPPAAEQQQQQPGAEAPLEEERRAHMEVELGNALTARMAGVLGILGIYLAWALLVWCG